MMLFSAQNLSCIRNHTLLFEDISFEIASGQLLLIEGHNGSGKTSLLKILTGLRRADSGKVALDNKAIDLESHYFFKHLAWIGHKNPLKEDLTAFENLKALSETRTRNKTPFNEALTKVGLGRVKHKRIKTFSAGMKRRLVLASLLTCDSKLWILDEPQASLDKVGIELFEQLAQAHLEQGGIIVMTSHHDINLNETFIQRQTLGV